MDEQLDNDLNNRIREVFDNFEDSSYPSADEGWMKLREKFPEKENKRPVAWLWWASTAAAVLLFLVIGLWITDKKTQPDTIAIKPLKQKALPPDSSQLLATKPSPAIKNNQGDATAAATDTNKLTNTPKMQGSRLAATSSPDATNGKARANTGANFTPAQLPSNNAQVASMQGKTDSTKTVIVKPNTSQYAAVTPAIGSNSTLAPVKTKPDSVKNIIAKTTTPQNTIAPANSSNTTVAAGSGVVNQQPFKTPKQAPTNSMERLFAADLNFTQKEY